MARYNYELPWHAVSRHYCKGRIFVGDRFFFFQYTFFCCMLLVATLAMISYKDFITDVQIPLYALEWILILSTFYNITMAGFSDPGIILKHPNFKNLRANAMRGLDIKPDPHPEIEDASTEEYASIFKPRWCN